MSEIENKGQLPVLDVFVQRDGANNLNVDIFRKDTSIQRSFSKNLDHRRRLLN